MGQQRTTDIGSGQRKVVDPNAGQGQSDNDNKRLQGLSEALRAINPAPRPVMGQSIGAPAIPPEFAEAVQQYKTAQPMLPIQVILDGLRNAR